MRSKNNVYNDSISTTAVLSSCNSFIMLQKLVM